MDAARLLLRFIGKASAFVLLFVALTALTAQAQEVCYVDTGGSDANNGEAATVTGSDGPKLTIQACVDVSYIGDDDGDIISIEAGTYDEQVSFANAELDSEIFVEARETGGFDVVEISDGIYNENVGESVTFRANTLSGFSAGVFLVDDGTSAYALDLRGGELVVEDPVEDGRFQLPDGVTIRRDDEASVSGEITFLGDVSVEYADDDASNTNVTTGSELPEDLGDGTLLVNLLGNNTLTLGQETTLSGATVSVNSEVSGTLVFSGGGGTSIVDGTGTYGDITIDGATDFDAAFSVSGDVVVNDDLAIDAGVDIAGALDINDGGDVDVNVSSDVGSVSMVAGSALDITGVTLTLENGDLSRTGGTFTATAASTLAFTGDDDDAELAPGPNFAVGILDVDKEDGTLTISNDVEVTATGTSFNVEPGTTVDFGSQAVTVSSTGTVDVDGTIESTVNGALVFTSEGSLSGSGEYSNILVNVSSGGDITIAVDVEFAGILTLNNGGIDATGNDISPTGNSASLVINLEGTGTEIDGSFNADNVDYSITYNGTPGAGEFVGDEFDAEHIVNATFNTDTEALILTHADPSTISGNVTLADGALVDLASDASLTIGGELTIGSDAGLGGGDAGETLTLSGDSETHSVVGQVSSASVLTVSGVSVTINGDSDEDEISELANLALTLEADVTVVDIQKINGLVRIGEDASLDLALAAEQEVGGEISLTDEGASLTLSSDISLISEADLDFGTLDFGSNDLSIDAAQSFDGAQDVTYTSTGGALIFTANGTLSTAGEVLPYLELDAAAIDLTGAVEIGVSLVEDGASDIDVDGNALTIAGTVASDGGTFITDGGAGSVTFNTTTVTLEGDAGIATETTVADGTTLTIATDDQDEPRDLLITGDFNLNGALVLGVNDISIDGDVDFVNDGGSVAASSGAVILSDANIDVDGELTIPNLTVLSPADLSGGDLTISGILDLQADFNEATNDDDVILANGATIDIGAQTPLVDDPTFADTVNVVYSVATNSGKEIPAEGDGAIGDMDVDDSVEFQDDVTVNGTLTLASSADNVSQTVDLVLAPGATLRLEALVTTVITDDTDITASEYAVVFAGPSDAISDEVFLDDATITTLEIDLADDDNDIELDEERTVNGVILSEGSLDLSAARLNVAGDFTIDGGGLINEDASAHAVLAFTAATADQTFTLDGDLEVDDIDVMLEKDSGIVLLAGPANATLDLRANSTLADPLMLFLNGGVLQTEDDTDVMLWQDENTQGFERSLGDGEVSHVAGNVTKRVQAGDPFSNNRSARFEFPTGSAGTETSDPEYRPFALTFRENIVSTTNVTLNHQNENPEGTVGLPVASGDVTVGNYPDYYWLVDASTSLGQSQAFDVELTATDIGLPFEDEEDLRIIRRFDGSATTNDWNVQGDASNYDNILAIDAEGDTTVVARVDESAGGIVTQGARFTLGIPTRAPLFVDGDGATFGFPADTLVVDEGDTLRFDFDAVEDIDEEVTYSLSNEPANATIDEDTGEFTFTPDYDQAGTYDITVTADDGTSQSSDEFTVTVNDVNSPPVFVAQLSDTTAGAGAEFSFDYDAEDADEDELTYALTEGPSGAEVDTTTGVVTWTPSVDDEGEIFDFVVEVTDGMATVASDTASVTVGEAVARGDVNGDGSLTPADASLVLAAVVGDTTLSGAAAFKADVSGNGELRAFDAGLMLECIAENGGLPVDDTETCDFPGDSSSKSGVVATADLGWGEARTVEGGNVAIPLIASGNVGGVYGVEFEGTMDLSSINLRSVNAQLPEGWQVAWSADEETGRIRIAAAGGTPISDGGTLAELLFEMEDPKAEVALEGEARVNENPSAVLGSMKVKEVPAEFALGENYPNPFNPTTTFEYGVPEAAHVTIEVYDVAGRLVQTLVDAEMEAGRYEVRWDGRSNAGSPVASGLYMYRMRADSFTKVKTMMLVK